MSNSGKDKTPANRMYFLVNKELDMGGGKVAAQVGHAAMELTRRQDNPEAQKYMNNSKIVVYVEDSYELAHYHDIAEDAGLMTTLIYDEFLGGSKTTVLGIGPVTPQHFKLFKELKLVP